MVRSMTEAFAVGLRPVAAGDAPARNAPALTEGVGDD
jgi:hypothetical protein